MARHPQTVAMASPDPVVSPSIQMEQVSAGYWRGEPVLDGLCAQLQGPGLFHLIGVNGSGKSTLLEVLAGYLEPWAGRVSLNGQPVRAGHLVAGLSLTRSDPAFVPGISVSDHLHLYNRRYGTQLAAALQLAERLGLLDHLDKPPAALSAGTAKKAWFVCHAMAARPVWCIDEPFNGVDVDSSMAMAEILAERSVTSLVVLTSHQLPAELKPVMTSAAISAPFSLKALTYA